MSSDLCDIPLCWLVNGDPYNGVLLFLYYPYKTGDCIIPCITKPTGVSSNENHGNFTMRSPIRPHNVSINRGISTFRTTASRVAIKAKVGLQPWLRLQFMWLKKIDLSQFIGDFVLLHSHIRPSRNFFMTSWLDIDISLEIYLHDFSQACHIHQEKLCFIFAYTAETGQVCIFLWARDQHKLQTFCLWNH